MYILHQDSGTYYNINAHRPMIDLFLLFVSTTYSLLSILSALEGHLSASEGH